MAQKDRRYSVQGEFTGAPKKEFVIRFCGTFVSAHATRDLADKEVARRKAEMDTPMVKPSWSAVEAA